jgi:mono/diheme cytochrome c family protein/glucose/arabinose dehydrogenase
MVKPAFYPLLLATGLLSTVSFTTNLSPAYDDPSPILTPTQEAATFQLEPGLHIQLVAAEPLVQAPVVINFDADGRLWVVEMRGYMSTIDASEESKPSGRVSVLEDQNGDGQMDKATVYLDSLIMPRAMAFAPDGVLVAENGALWLTKDLNGDLKADTKTLIDKDYAGSALPEHAGNGLWRGLDNWYYNAKSRFRYRHTNGSWQRDSTEFRGQWGLSHDNQGRLHYNYNWSQLHADLVPANYLSANRNHTPTTGIDHGLTVERQIYPIRSNPAVNRGYIPGTLDKNNRLLEFTAACSPLVYRGTALPMEFAGNVFVCEPAGNLIKRNVVTANGPVLAARDPHPGREFLASTDERFRPVHMATGPDGALYVADMYRGIIQHAAYMTPYLKDQTLARNLTQPVDRGRIWRIVPKSWQTAPTQKLSRATNNELIQALNSPDGWHRDMAQHLLVARNNADARSALTALAQKGTNPYGRAQALWALDGLNQNRPDVLLGLLTDAHPFVQTTALRLLEPFAQTDATVRAKLAGELLQRVNSAPADVCLQMALSARVLDRPAAHALLEALVSRPLLREPLLRDAVLSSLYNGEWAFLQRLWKAPRWQTADPAREIFVEMLATSVVRKGAPEELSALLTLLDNPTKPFGWREKALLSGLTVGSSATKTTAVRLPKAPRLLSQPKQTLTAAQTGALTNLYDWPGKTQRLAANASAGQKANTLSADDQKLFATGRQMYLSTCSGCHGTNGAGMARFAPPLINSDWVLGDGKRLALILLHGMEGPVDVAGKVYNAPDILPVMPAHSTLDDNAIAAILTYIRNEWGHNAGPVSRRLVGMTRVTSQGRVVPWTVKDLNQYMLQNGAESGK